MLKQIEVFENIYSITREGRIWSHDRIKISRKREYKIKGQWRKLKKTNKGYLEINLFKNGKPIFKRIHRLVAETYIPNPENKPDINHLDGNKLNNHVSNLQWVTSKENHSHAWKIGLYDNRDTSGENNGQSKLTQIQVNEIRQNHVKKGTYTRKPWEKYNISRGYYYDILKYRTWKIEELLVD